MSLLRHSDVIRAVGPASKLRENASFMRETYDPRA